MDDDQDSLWLTLESDLRLASGGGRGPNTKNL